VDALKILNVPGGSEIFVLAEINPSIKANSARSDVHSAFIVVRPNAVRVGRRKPLQAHVVLDKGAPFIVF